MNQVFVRFRLVLFTLAVVLTKTYITDNEKFYSSLQTTSSGIYNDRIVFEMCLFTLAALITVAAYDCEPSPDIPPHD